MVDTITSYTKSWGNLLGCFIYLIAQDSFNAKTGHTHTEIADLDGGGVDLEDRRPLRSRTGHSQDSIGFQHQLPV